MRVERAWYESSPYLYVGLGVLAISYEAGPLLMKASGAVLLAASLTIVGLRWIYRRDLGQQTFEVDPQQYIALITQDLFYDASPDARSTSSRRRP